jgi:UDP-N-acetylmuramoylalanine--D-glutamate ligase
VESGNMKIAIAGFDREGRSTLRYLREQEEYRGAQIWVLDRNPLIKVSRGVRAATGTHYLAHLEMFDVVFRTPGLRYLSLEIQRAIRRGVRVTSATKLFFDKFPGRIIGVTGTKGKGTTSALIYEVLKAAGKDVSLVGNIGTPALDLLASRKKLGKNSWAVYELSSFQLMDLERSPYIGVVLMVTSEHMDWHKNAKEYVAAKSSIVRFQAHDNFAVIAADYPRSRSYARLTKAKIFDFSRRRTLPRGTYVRNGTFIFTDGRRKEAVCATGDLRVPGAHNFENAAAAITVAKILRIPNALIKTAISRFRGLPNRLEFVAKKNGVRYYNDSYATTPETAEVAIAAFKEPKILILGGSHKGSDFRHLGRAISRSRSVKAIIGIGVEWPRIRAHIHNKKVRMIEDCKNMRAIVRAAARAAAPGDVVLLSPACASFGMFENYTERGAQFRASVTKLK